MSCSKIMEEASVRAGKCPSVYSEKGSYGSQWYQVSVAGNLSLGLQRLSVFMGLLQFHSCEPLPSFCKDYLNIYPFLLLDLSCVVLVPVASLLCVS